MPFTTGHDLFGDGSLVVLPTPGHTAGSTSLLVRRPDHPPLLMVGDLTYDADLLAVGTVPGVGNKRQMRRAVAAVNGLRRRMPGLTVLAAHDPSAAARLSASLNTRTPQECQCGETGLTSPMSWPRAASRRVSVWSGPISNRANRS